MEDGGRESKTYLKRNREYQKANGNEGMRERKKRHFRKTPNLDF